MPSFDPVPSSTPKSSCGRGRFFLGLSICAGILATVSFLFVRLADRTHPELPKGESSRQTEELNWLDCRDQKGVAPEVVRRTQQVLAEDLDVPVEVTVDLGEGVGMPFVLIPPGMFVMGAPFLFDEDATETERPRHNVTLTRPFYIGKCEVTQEQYVTLTGKPNPSRFRDDAKSPQYPVESVTLHEAKEACDRLAEKELPGRFRRVGLPTEAQWEYVCRAGTTTVYSFGDRWKASLANAEQANRHPLPVGSFPPNAFGIHDMHGNVLERCADGWLDDAYKRKTYTDPFVALAVDSKLNVIRGGSWDDPARMNRSTSRDWMKTDRRSETTGFRMVLLFE